MPQAKPSVQADYTDPSEEVPQQLAKFKKVVDMERAKYKTLKMLVDANEAPAPEALVVRVAERGMVGPKGPRGLRGADGDEGVQGPNGAPGTPGGEDLSATWILATTSQQLAGRLLGENLAPSPGSKMCVSYRPGPFVRGAATLIPHNTEQLVRGFAFSVSPCENSFSEPSCNLNTPGCTHLWLSTRGALHHGFCPACTGLRRAVLIPERKLSGLVSAATEADSSAAGRPRTAWRSWGDWDDWRAGQPGGTPPAHPPCARAEASADCASRACAASCGKAGPGPEGACAGGAVQEKGKRGFEGRVGKRGVQGAEGGDGPGGGQGMVGDRGPPGPQGVNGPMGSEGNDGARGETGTSGNSDFKFMMAQIY